METLEIKLNFEKQQLISIFKQLKPLERKQIFAEFEEEFFEYFFEDKTINRMTIEEYNLKLAESELAYKNGQFKTQKELEKEIEKWI
jgi:hypothetical protein